MKLECTIAQHGQYLDNFIQELHEARFYDAHESLELIWFPRRFEDCDEIRVIKGFINAAVCFELIKKGRVEPAQKVWLNYIKYKKLIHNIDSPHIAKYLFIAQLLETIKKSHSS